MSIHNHRAKTLVPVIKAITLCMLLAGIFTTERATAEKTYKNPVLVETFSSPIMGTIGIGDPTVISYEGKYYLYPTGDNHSYDVYISSDLIHWEKGPKVFRYAESGVWAPDVFYNPADWKFYLYYTVHRRIGVAVADRPDGTFTDLGALVNNAIDAHLFLDEDGKYYLYYVQFPAFTICVQPMETPVRKKGEPLKIIQPGQLWEKKNGPVTEAPWVLKHQGIYYLLYSGGGPDTQDYAIGYAISQSPIGPFVKYFGNPIVKKGKRAFGPGHCSVIKTPDGKLWMVYHQKKGGSRGWDRIICIDQLWFDNTGTLHGKATRSTLQPAPVTAAKPMGKDKSP